MEKIKTFFRSEYIFLLILTIGIFLRVWKLPELGILFADAGHDLIAAQQIIETKTIPFKGIATSIPIFHQGPFMVWYLALLLWIGQGSLTVVYIGSALTGILSLVLLYFIMEEEVKNRLGSYIATFVLATSPLAVAHARMPYHTTPIPLIIVLYLWSLVRLYHKKRFALIMTGLTIALAVQFELVLIPLAVAIIYVLWRSKQLSLNTLLTIAISGAVGSITFFSQWGNMYQWIVQPKNSTILDKLQRSYNAFPETVANFHLYFTRIWSVDNQQLFMVAVVMMIFSLVIIYKKRHTLPVLVEFTALCFFLLTIVYILRGKPSEAYIPPYFIFVPILMGYALSQIEKVYLKYFATAVLITIGAFNVVAIYQNNFFVTPNNSPFNYGVGVGEQISIVREIARVQRDQPYQFRTTIEEHQFPAFFDNYRFIANQFGQPEQKTENSSQIFIEGKENELNDYPNAYYLEFPSVKMIKILPE